MSRAPQPSRLVDRDRLGPKDWFWRTRMDATLNLSRLAASLRLASRSRQHSYFSREYRALDVRVLQRAIF